MRPNKGGRHHCLLPSIKKLHELDKVHICAVADLELRKKKIREIEAERDEVKNNILTFVVSEAIKTALKKNGKQHIKRKDVQLKKIVANHDTDNSMCKKVNAIRGVLKNTHRRFRKSLKRHYSINPSTIKQKEKVEGTTEKNTAVAESRNDYVGRFVISTLTENSETDEAELIGGDFIDSDGDGRLISPPPPLMFWNNAGRPYRMAANVARQREYIQRINSGVSSQLSIEDDGSIYEPNSTDFGSDSDPENLDFEEVSY